MQLCHKISLKKGVIWEWSCFKPILLQVCIAVAILTQHIAAPQMQNGNLSNTNSIACDRLSNTSSEPSTRPSPNIPQVITSR